MIFEHSFHSAILSISALNSKKILRNLSLKLISVINVINESLKTVKRQRKKQIKLAIIEKSENGKQIRAKRRRAGGISQPSTSEFVS